MDFGPENFTHPEKFYPGLIWAPNSNTPEWASKNRLDIDPISANDSHRELCWSCSWTTHNQTGSSYASRIRILQTRANSGMWALGSKLILKDFPNDGCSPGNDYMTQKFLRNQPGLTIPLLREIRLLSQPTDKTYLLLMSRAEGRRFLMFGILYLGDRRIVLETSSSDSSKRSADLQHQALKPLREAKSTILY
jgi:hypothetical protein